MILGVNFRHDIRQPATFDRGAARALRPDLVRHVVTRPESVQSWIESARATRIRVLWCLLPEVHGTPATNMAAKWICSAGLDVTGGIELGGGNPWRIGSTPTSSLIAACEVADTLSKIREHAGGVFRFAFGAHRPIILNSGYTPGDRHAAAYLGELRKTAGRKSTRWLVRRLFHAVSVNATAAGRPFSTIMFRGCQASIADAFGLPITFTRIGWQAGEDLRPTVRLVESARAFSDGQPYAWIRTLTPAIRRRWYLEALAEASRLRALHFMVEPDHALPGENQWGLYRSASALPDPIWTALQFRAGQVPAGGGR